MGALGDGASSGEPGGAPRGEISGGKGSILGGRSGPDGDDSESGGDVGGIGGAWPLSLLCLILGRVPQSNVRPKVLLHIMSFNHDGFNFQTGENPGE